MFKTNPLQFSVVREDPEIEIALLRKFDLKNPIIVGSGGCTGLALAVQFPMMPIALIEPNPSQVKLIKEKVKVLAKFTKSDLEKKFGAAASSNFKSKSNLTLIEMGNFESLFRSLRNFIHEFIVDENQIEKILVEGTDKEWKAIFVHPYWAVGFDLFFSNSILHAMFGPAAIQHAPPESYSKYFRLVYENGILRSDRRTNYFLHHLLLGHYPKSRKHWPVFLQSPPRKVNFTIFQCLADAVPSYSNFDFVSLSNIFDWSSEQEIRILAKKLDRELKPGAVILFRQLNNSKNFISFFGKNFKWCGKEAKQLHQNDRSLFYSSIHIARKV